MSPIQVTPCLSMPRCQWHCFFHFLCVASSFSLLSPHSFPTLSLSYVFCFSLLFLPVLGSCCPQVKCLFLLASHLFTVFCYSPGLLIDPSQPTSTNSDPQAKFLSLGFSLLSAKSDFPYCQVSLVGTVELYITVPWKLETKTECLPNHSLADTQV